MSLDVSHLGPWFYWTAVGSEDSMCSSGPIELDGCWVLAQVKIGILLHGREY